MVTTRSAGKKRAAEEALEALEDQAKKQKIEDAQSRDTILALTQQLFRDKNTVKLFFQSGQVTAEDAKALLNHTIDADFLAEKCAEMLISWMEARWRSMLFYDRHFGVVAAPRIPPGAAPDVEDTQRRVNILLHGGNIVHDSVIAVTHFGHAWYDNPTTKEWYRGHLHRRYRDMYLITPLQGLWLAQFAWRENRRPGAEPSVPGLKVAAMLELADKFITLQDSIITFETGRVTRAAAARPQAWANFMKLAAGLADEGLKGRKEIISMRSNNKKGCGPKYLVADVDTVGKALVDWTAAQVTTVTAAKSSVVAHCRAEVKDLRTNFES